MAGLWIIYGWYMGNIWLMMVNITGWWFGTWLDYFSIYWWLMIDASYILYTSGWWWLEHDFYFPTYWEWHHPNWLSYFSEVLKPPTSGCQLMVVDGRTQTFESIHSIDFDGGWWFNLDVNMAKMGILLEWVSLWLYWCNFQQSNKGNSIEPAGWQSYWRRLGDNLKTNLVDVWESANVIISIIFWYIVI